MCAYGRVSASAFVEFLRRLVHDAPGMFILTVDGHPIHKATIVRDCVTQISEWLELFILPPCARELNPDELGWNNLRHRAIGRPSINGSDQLKRTVIPFLR